jgi:hypothetical protein
MNRSFRGHEIDKLNHSVFTQEARHKNVCVGPIELLALGNASASRYSKESSSAIVQDRGKDSGRIEIREAQKIDVPVDSNESARYRNNSKQLEKSRQ